MSPIGDKANTPDAPESRWQAARHRAGTNCTTASAKPAAWRVTTSAQAGTKGKQLAILAPGAREIKKALRKLEKVAHDCDKTVDQLWYTKGMAILEIRNNGLYKAAQGANDFDENGKPIEWTFEEYLKREFQMSRRRGYQLLDSVSFMRKLGAVNVHKNAEIVHIQKVTQNTEIGYSECGRNVANWRH